MGRRLTGSIGLAPMVHALPAGLSVVPRTDFPPSRVVVAWPAGVDGPLVRSFIAIAAAVHRS